MKNYINFKYRNKSLILDLYKKFSENMLEFCEEAFFNLFRFEHEKLDVQIPAEIKYENTTITDFCCWDWQGSKRDFYFIIDRISYHADYTFDIELLTFFKLQGEQPTARRLQNWRNKETAGRI